MKKILTLLLACLCASHAPGKDPVFVKNAFVLLKYGTVELESKDGTKREVSHQPESEQSTQPRVFRVAEGETIPVNTTSTLRSALLRKTSPQLLSL